MMENIIIDSLNAKILMNEARIKALQSYTLNVDFQLEARVLLKENEHIKESIKNLKKSIK